MMSYKKYFTKYSGVFLLILIMLVQVSCKKYLDERPNKSQRVISSLQDLQAVLDFETQMNKISSVLLLYPSDEYYLTFNVWASNDIDFRLSYIWDDGVAATITSRNSWYFPYNVVRRANIVLQELPKMEVDDDNRSSYNNIRGSALFYRSNAFYHLAQLFCKPWSSTASTDLGIVLRMVPDIDVKSERATVQQTYEQIISDLKESVNLLPQTPLGVTRPGKAAAWGLLARTYLSMRDYVNAGLYSDSCLKLYHTLLDFNTLDTTLLFPIGISSTYNNPEIIFNCTVGGSDVPNQGLIDTTLYQSYSNNDLRRAVCFFQNADGFVFKGYYIYDYDPFIGIATDEMYLIRAECAARAGDIDAAMADLNTLLIKRWKSGTFVPFSAANSTEALNQVLIERRKELLFRGVRWSDLRRFNLEGAGITLTRILNGVTYTLPANDPRWTMLIPLKVIDLTGMPQNER